MEKQKGSVDVNTPTSSYRVPGVMLRGGDRLRKPGLSLVGGMFLVTAGIHTSALSGHTLWPRSEVTIPGACDRSRSCREHNVCRLVCRFSDAGKPSLSTRSGGRRPKSAKARNRGGWDTAVPRAMGN
jgi:hypothetical protein